MADLKIPDEQLTVIDEHLSNHPDTVLRDEQLPPDEEWFIWYLRCGRGWGKTRTGSEWFHQRAKQKPGRWMALIAETPADARDDCIRGPGGILKNTPPDIDVDYEPSKRRITWSNDSYATIYSGANPEQLRGFSGDTAWCDEMAAWEYPKDAWDNLMFGLREGEDPKVVVSTTPKPLDILKRIENEYNTVTVRGSSFDNRENLSEQYYKNVIEPKEGTRKGKQEIKGEYLEEAEHALWNNHIISDTRDKTPSSDIVEKIIVVDPSAEDKDDSDECGIIGMSSRMRDDQKHGYVEKDFSINGHPSKWGKRVWDSYKQFGANLIVYEKNMGGKMVEEVVKSSIPDGQIEPQFYPVDATDGKRTRAEPIATLYEKHWMHHTRVLSELESQMTTWEPGDDSPDRMDAMVWGGHYLFCDILQSESRAGAW